MAKRNNDNGPIDSYEDLEMEDIDDFDPFDVLDDSYDDRRVYKNPKAPKSTYDKSSDRKKGAAQSRRKSGKRRNPVLVWAGRVAATLISTILIILIFLYSVMAMLVYGPSKTAKIQFVLSVQETSAIGFLANWFCSQNEIDQIKANNAIKETDDITDADLVTIDTTAQDPETPDIEIVNVKGATYSGKLMIVKDPSRLFVGTVPEFTNGNGMVVADIAKRYDAIGGVNGGEFVDGDITYTAKPIGLVMKDGEVLNDNGGTSHVTGITYDNKLVLGNMNAAKAKELNIRDCVSISNHIGPFLIVNGEAQDIVGIAGGTNPRTAIGQTADGKILLLAVDGRQPNSIGATFSDLQDIMAQYGAVSCKCIYNGWWNINTDVL